MSPLAISLRFLQTQPDQRLVELARAGHERAFEALVRRYRGALLAYCRRVAPNGTSSEDILQQALLQAWRDWALGDAGGATAGLAGAGSAGLGALTLKGGAVLAVGAVAGTTAIVVGNHPRGAHHPHPPAVASSAAYRPGRGGAAPARMG